MPPSEDILKLAGKLRREVRICLAADLLALAGPMEEAHVLGFLNALPEDEREPFICMVQDIAEREG